MPFGTGASVPSYPIYPVPVVKEDFMRYALGLALLLLPATAYAQMFEGPTGSIPMTECVSTPSGPMCSTVIEGAGLTALPRGWVRADQPGVVPRRFGSPNDTVSGPSVGP